MCGSRLGLDRGAGERELIRAEPVNSDFSAGSQDCSCADRLRMVLLVGANYIALDDWDAMAPTAGTS